MKAMIGAELVRKLPKENKDIRDTKLKGFVLRCRASGAHSYLFQVGRGQWVTLGREKSMTPVEARLAAEKIRGDVSKKALDVTSEDPGLTHGEAKAVARADIRRRRTQRNVRTFGTFVSEAYEPWARE